MASITIRGLDETLKGQLRVQAARHCRSMEMEVREILKVAVSGSTGSKGNFADALRRYVEPFGGVELAIEPREPVRRAPVLGK